MVNLVINGPIKFKVTSLVFIFLMMTLSVKCFPDLESLNIDNSSFRLDRLAYFLELINQNYADSNYYVKASDRLIDTDNNHNEKYESDTKSAVNYKNDDFSVKKILLEANINYFRK